MNCQTTLVDINKQLRKASGQDCSIKPASLVINWTELAGESSGVVQLLEKDELQSVTTDLGIRDLTSSISRCSLNSRLNSNYTTDSNQEQNEATARCSNKVKSSTALLTGYPTQKDYFIPGLYRHRSSYLESMEDSDVDTLTRSPTEFILPKGTKVPDLPEEVPRTISTEELPASCIETDEGTTPGFACKVEYRFPHIIERTDDAFKTELSRCISIPRTREKLEARDQAACELLTVEERPEIRFPSFDSSSDSWSIDSEIPNDDTDCLNQNSDEDHEELDTALLGKRKPLRPTRRQVKKAIKP